MAWGTASADVSHTVAAKTEASVKASHQAKAPTYTGKVLQSTRNGMVQGYVKNHSLIWKGIPYGRAERWKAPTDVKAWNGIFDATKTGPIAIQGAIGKTKGSEDCLNLDIFRPNTKEKNLPVLFFIHGGNNQSGAADQVNWQKFVEREHVVAISINHSLGALGFNPLPALKHGTAEENPVTLLYWILLKAWTGRKKILPALAEILTISRLQAFPLVDVTSWHC